MQFTPPVLKIMWLSRNTRVMDSFSSQKWEVYICSMRSGYSVFRFYQSALLARQAQMTSHQKKQKNYGLDTIARVPNIS